ncbi:MAG: glycosyltransferase family 2 protein [Candidatus Zixiibacteriota bacterium]
MTLVSAVVITKDEEKNIRRCLESVRWADEVIVVDSNSSDNTCEIAADCGARIIPHEWRGYGAAKREGVQRAAGEWVLSVDADEEVSSELAGEIQAVIRSADAADGYYIPRSTSFLGRWIRHCGWYPDLVLRLFRRDKGNFTEDVVHEKVLLNGQSGRLRGELLHYCYVDLEQYLTKSNRYTTLGALAAYQSGRRASCFDLAVRPIVSFFSHYVVRQGFRDGMEGFIVSAMSANAVLGKYVKLRHLQNSAKRPKGEQ